MPFTDSGTGPLIRLVDVAYQYPRADSFALLNLNLEVRQGEFLGIIGPTGAGKTTLCLTINGIVPQFFGGRFFGHAMVGGLDTVENPISLLAGMVGQVFEDPETQIITTSVENEIAFALENLKVPREVMRDRIAEALTIVRLGGYEKKHPHELSAGQKQRLAIAAAIAVKPDVLVLDEPTSQLDPVGVEQIFATIQELNQQLGMTIIMASHAAEELASFAHRIAVISQGNILRSGTPDEVYRDIELLLSLDIRPPQVAQVFYLLQKNGLKFPKIPVRLEDALPLLGELPVIERSAGDNTLPDSVAEHEPGSSPLNDSPVLSVKQLTHIYPDGTRALNQISLDIYPGEYVLLVGQNGAGKTTLVKHFLNLLQPTAGTVLLGGQLTGKLNTSDLARRIGYVAQNPDNQIFNKTVRDEVEFAPKNLGYLPSEINTHTEQALEAMGLNAVSDRHPLSLPKGDRARVVVAAILAMQPEIIIFDEPTTGQDYTGAQHILEITKKLHQAGKTIIVVTHHLYLMPGYAERVVMMGAGEIIFDGDIRTAYHARDALSRTHLSPPQAVQVAERLRAFGYPVPLLLTPEEIAAAWLPDGRSFDQQSEKNQP